MDSIEPPSFSLGFDLSPNPNDEDEPEPGLTVADSDLELNPNEDGEPEPGLTVSDSDLDLDPGFSSPVLKRLRRGITMNKPPPKVDTIDLLGCKEDEDVDEIEEFSSPEDGPASTRSHFSSCSSRVPSLHGSGVISKQPSISRSRSQEKRKRLDVPSSAAGSGSTSIASLFQRTAALSPLRRFQLIDSDSEDDHLSKRRVLNELSSRRNLSGVTKTNSSYLKNQPSVASKQKRKEPGSMPRNVDLWKDFSPVAASKIQTPALDDVCQDYFSSIKTSSTSQKQRSNVASSSNSRLFQDTGEFVDSSHPSPPSHRFFLHSDPRIQSLARQRLPYFLPLGINSDKERGREVCLIDYMNQFSGKESSKTGEADTKGKSKPKGSNKRSSSPKDAGKRRVSANSGSAGHWLTSSEGRKVYISKSGQEFSGQSAYRCYKKETGGGFNKYKKKRQPKKKKAKK
ncbi:unnamed protein product [Cochlearia groenlandica]